MGWGTSGHAFIYSVFVEYLLWSHVYFSSIKSKNNLIYPNLPRSYWSDTIYPELRNSRWIMQTISEGRGIFIFQSLAQQVKWKGPSDDPSRYLSGSFERTCSQICSFSFLYSPLSETAIQVRNHMSIAQTVTRLDWLYSSMSIQ